MTCAETFDFHEPQWCPGCGNFDILVCFKEALCGLGLKPQEFIMVTGIGQASKLGFSVKCNLFDGLHGRALPVATGINMANHKVKLISVSGDGDYYGEGGNHFIHAARRNLNIAVFAGDNRVYGLTKGQASPTSSPGFVTPIHPEGVGGKPISPVLLALASGATFVARAFSGNKEELSGLMRQAIEHKGFALVDIMSPCITFNKTNTFGWFKNRAKALGPGHDPSSFEAAIKLASAEQDSIATGVIYKACRPAFDARFSALKGETIAARTADFVPGRVRPLFERFK